MLLAATEIEQLDPGMGSWVTDVVGIVVPVLVVGTIAVALAWLARCARHHSGRLGEIERRLEALERDPAASRSRD